jgi:hypothetical protein
MVDREPEEYRPRRAYLEPEPSQDKGPSDASDAAEQVEESRRNNRPDSGEFGVSSGRGSAFDDGGIEAGWIDTDDGYATGVQSALSPDRGKSQQPGRNGSGHYDPVAHTDYVAPSDRDYPHLPPRQSIFTDLDDEDQPPPLYRDESATTPLPRSGAEPTLGSTMFRGPRPLGQEPNEDEVAPPLYRTSEETQPPQRTEPALPLYRDEVPGAGTGGQDAGSATWVRPAMSGAARRPQARDEESTTLLPRTPTGSRNTRDWQDSIDDFSDIDENRSRLGRKTKLALLISLVAAVVVIGLAIGYAVLGLGKTSGATPTPGRPTTSQPSISSAKPSQTQPAVVLSDDSMINAKDAKHVDKSRTWKVAMTQRGRTKDSPACLGGDPVEGQPTAQLTVLRMLSASGKQSPAILHEADAFTSAEEATQAYAVAAKTLGGCLEVGGYIESGWSVSNLGNQSLGLVVPIVDGSKTQHHTIVLSRTGLVLNVAEAAQPGDSVGVSKVAKALAAAINAQCRGAAGTCAGSVAVKRAPPPVGGDEPGFLAAGDLPPVKGVASLWVGNDPDVPNADFLGSQCENVNWAKADAQGRTARTYLLQEGSDPGFGLDEIILTMKDSKAATSFVKKLRTSVADCRVRRLTATVTKPSTVEGVGASNTQVSGWTATVSQKATGRTNKYRVGAVAVGAKVVYTFLSPKGNYDLTDSLWDGVAVRSGERASQVN